MERRRSGTTKALRHKGAQGEKISENLRAFNQRHQQEIDTRQYKSTPKEAKKNPPLSVQSAPSVNP